MKYNSLNTSKKIFTTRKLTKTTKRNVRGRMIFQRMVEYKNY